MKRIFKEGLSKASSSSDDENVAANKRKKQSSSKIFDMMGPLRLRSTNIPSNVISKHSIVDKINPLTRLTKKISPKIKRAKTCDKNDADNENCDANKVTKNTKIFPIFQTPNRRNARHVGLVPARRTLQPNTDKNKTSAYKSSVVSALAKQSFPASNSNKFDDEDENIEPQFSNSNKFDGGEKNMKPQFNEEKEKEKPKDFVIQRVDRAKMRERLRQRSNASVRKPGKDKQHDEEKEKIKKKLQEKKQKNKSKAEKEGDECDGHSDKSGSYGSFDDNDFAVGAAIELVEQGVRGIWGLPPGKVLVPKPVDTSRDHLPCYCFIGGKKSVRGQPPPTRNLADRLLMRSREICERHPIARVDGFTCREDAPYYEEHTKNSKIVLDNKNNVLLSHYSDDVYAYMRWREKKIYGNLKKRDYMHKQSEINLSTRETLIEWFVDIVLEFKLSSCTFFMAVSLLDRVLSVIDCPTGKLQLVGAATLFISSKMEDSAGKCLTVTSLANLSNQLYQPPDICRMERIIIQIVDHDIKAPYVDFFAHYYLFLEIRIEPIRKLIWYFLELSCRTYHFIKYLPSQVAAAAYVIANYIYYVDYIDGLKIRGIKRFHRKYPQYVTHFDELPGGTIIDQEFEKLDYEVWSANIVTKTGIETKELYEPVQLFAKLYRSAKGHNAGHSIFRKYATKNNLETSTTYGIPNRLPFDPPRPGNVGSVRLYLSEDVPSDVEVTLPPPKLPLRGQTTSED